MPKNILKNIRNISDDAKAVTSIARNVLSPVKRRMKLVKLALSPRSFPGMLPFKLSETKFGLH